MKICGEEQDDEDFGNLFRIETLAPAEDSGPFQVVYISNDGTVGAGGFFNFFAHIVCVGGTVNQAFVERRHSAGYVVDEGSLAAAGVEYAVFTEATAPRAKEKSIFHLPSSSMAACMP